MNGPTVNHTSESLNLGDANHVQEALAIIGVTTSSYALLGYVPATARSVLIFKDGLMLLQGVDYTIDGRKIAFTTPFTDDGGGLAVEAATASYITTNEVATIPAVTIEFDIPGQNVRVGVGGALQIQIEDPALTFTWYDMLPVVDPVSGAISFITDQTPSLNQ